MNNYLPALTIVLFSLFLYDCPSPVDTGGKPEPTSTPVPEGAPKILAQIPADGSSSVYTNTNIVIQFDEIVTRWSR